MYLLNKCHDGEIECEGDLDSILKKLIGDYMKSIYTYVPSNFLGRLQECCRLKEPSRVSDTRSTPHRNYRADDSEVLNPEEAENEAQEIVYRDLFLWCILTNRIEMSKVILGNDSEIR